MGKFHVWFTADKNGAPIAYRCSWSQMRCFRIGWDEAKLLVSTGKAEEISGSPPWFVKR